MTAPELSGAYGARARNAPDNSAAPPAVEANPRLSTWLDLATPGRVRVGTGKVELGQGILTAIGQIVVDELGIAPSRVEVTAADTEHGPNEGVTAGSLSITQSGAAVRHVCRVLLGLLSTRVAEDEGCAPEDLRLADGCFVRDGDEITDLWSAASRVDLAVDATAAPLPAARVVRAGDAELRRVDLTDKLLGRRRFIHDLAMDGMLHGRVVRPPRPGARLDAVDSRVLSDLGSPDDPNPSRFVVREGSFLGVVADDEHAVEQAQHELATAAVWAGGTELPSDPVGWLREQPAETTIVVRSEGAPGRIGAGDPHAEPIGTGDPRAKTDLAQSSPQAATHRAAYSRPPLAHASIAPSCAIARWDGSDRVEVWTHSQGIYPLRAAIAQSLDLDPSRVVVRHAEGAGCYGHNGADDAAYDAVLLARAAVGRPVRVQWSRADELTWAPFGSAMAVDLSATLGPDSRVTGWRHELWSNGFIARPGYAGQPGLLADTHRRDAEPVPAVDPPAERGHGSARNAVPGYDLGRIDVVAHRALTMPVRTSSLRSLGAHLNVFAIESFLDELATAAGADPLEFRLTHLTDERAADVLRLAAERSDWPEPRPDDTGRGIAYARYKNRGGYCAVVAEVEAVDRLAVRRLTVAVDVGRVVSLDGVRNQLEGGAIQATSWTVKEQVRLGSDGVENGDWESYPILRFADVPRVEVHVIDRPDAPSLGAGEAAQGPVAAAIGNALADAIGVRVRDLPLTPDRIAAAIENG
ncbi:MAG TPA: molybdopterin cofactor-binding domain-containing protein [Nocardioidaceae bacterium]|nr:molybdopterin cofactor-binding domain-containing protein [Nocardioidaceae bacterium]